MRTIFALLLMLATAATAEAHWLNRWGRHLGLGWSDGYHAPSNPQHFSSFAIPPGGLSSPGPAIVPTPLPKLAAPPVIELPR